MSIQELGTVQTGIAKVQISDGGVANLNYESDEDGTSVTDLGDLTPKINSEQVLIGENANISIDKSSDVIIGPVTQFLGTVKIYNGSQNAPENNKLPLTNGINQEKNGQIKTTELPIDRKLPTAEKNVNFPGRNSRKKIFKPSALVYFFVAIISALAVSVFCYFMITTDGTLQNNDAVDTTSSATTGIEVTTQISGHYFLNREAWGAIKRKSWEPLAHPTPVVAICHTATPMCFTDEDCFYRLQSIQSHFINEKHEPDIGYNFLIGGTGDIYEGRGWNAVNSDRNKTLTISFIGKFVEGGDELSSSMGDALKILIDVGRNKSFISEDYKLVPHYLIKPTESPGTNVIKVIKKLPHYYGW